MVVRGGFGVFYDVASARSSTQCSALPFLREIEITVPSGNVPIANAFGAQPTTLPLSSWLPFRVTRAAGAGGTYVIRDNTGVSSDARGTPTTPAGNIAETFEFRAVDRNLKTPYVQQWNLGFSTRSPGHAFRSEYVAPAARIFAGDRLHQGFDLNVRIRRITSTNALTGIPGRSAPTST